MEAGKSIRELIFMEDTEAQRVIEAALFMSSRPLSLPELGKLIGVAAP